MPFDEEGQIVIASLTEQGEVLIGTTLTEEGRWVVGAAAPAFPDLSWQGVQPALLELGVGAMIPSGPMPGRG